MKKMYFFISLIAIFFNVCLFSTDQKRLEVIHAHYTIGQTIISENHAHDINLLQHEIEQLKIKKQDLESFYNKLITPVLYATSSITLGSIILLTIALHTKILKEEYLTLKEFYKELIGNVIKKNNRILPSICFLVSPFITIVAGLCSKKLFIKAWDHKQKTTKKLQEIETAITRNQTIIAQLVDQTKLKENNE